MTTPARQTLARATTVSGTGLHTGAAVTARLAPAASGSGVTFRRTDLADAAPIPARLDAVADAERRTVLGTEPNTVDTVEHVLAAALACGVDDLTVEIDGPEPPIGDGSAAAYVEAMTKAGTRPQPDGAAPNLVRLRAPLTVTEGDATYVLAPADRLRLTVTIDIAHPLVGRQSGCYDVAPDGFAADLAQARTFGFVGEREALAAKGLALGADARNVIALSADGIAAGAPLRWPDEFVRHKAVDLLGDLALLGGRLRADVVAFRPGHRANIAMARVVARLAQPAGTPVMGIQEILGIIPHRYPMLLVDRIVEVHGRERIVGIKNVTVNEPFFQGHFPDHPIMPGVLIIEAMAQVGGMLMMGAVDDPQSKVVYFLSLDGVKFRRPVVPGDQIRFELEMLQFRGRNCKMRGVGYVDGQPVAEADMTARIVDR